MNNKKITYSIRKEIEFLLSNKDSNVKLIQQDIAYMLNISRPLLSKELKRCPIKYEADIAQTHFELEERVKLEEKLKLNRST